VRAEALQGLAARNDVVPRQNGAPPGPGSPRGQAPESKDARPPGGPSPEASKGLRSAGLPRLMRRI
jgi:hypothetical protein